MNIDFIKIHFKLYNAVVYNYKLLILLVQMIKVLLFFLI